MVGSPRSRCVKIAEATVDSKSDIRCTEGQAANLTPCNALASLIEGIFNPPEDNVVAIGGGRPKACR
jgi:hypothetical protein